MIVPDVGGGFGVKLHYYPEDVLVCVAAMRLGRPVRWIEDRREHFVATVHAREQTVHARAAFDTGGALLALDVARPRRRRRAPAHKGWRADIPRRRGAARSVHRAPLPRPPGGRRDEQGALRRLPRFRHAAGGVRDRAAHGRGGRAARDRSRRDPPPELSAAGRVPVPQRGGDGLRQRRLPAARSTARSRSPTTRGCARCRRASGRRGGSSGSDWPAMWRSRAWGPRASWRRWATARAGTRRRSSASTRPAARRSSPASSRSGRGSARRWRRWRPRSSRFRTTRVRVVLGDTEVCPYSLLRHGGQPRLGRRAARRCSRRRGSCARASRGWPRTCWRPAWRTSSSSTASAGCAACRGAR